MWQPEGRVVAGDRDLRALDALRHLIAFEDDAGRPVVLRLDAEPHPATRRLMDTLGVRVEVRPVRRRTEATHAADGTLTLSELDRRHEASRDAQPLTTRCAVGGCDWSHDGTAVEGREAAEAHRADAHPWVRRGRDAAAPANGHVSAGGGRAALDAMDAGEPQAPEPEPEIEPDVEPEPKPEPKSSVDVDVGAEGEQTGERAGRQPTRWTRETILAEIRGFADAHGRPPTQRDMPGGATVAARREFGSWADAVVAAGFERPARGKTRYARAGVAQPDRAPAARAGDAAEPRPDNVRNEEAVKQHVQEAASEPSSFSEKAHRLADLNAEIAAARARLLDLQAEALVLLDDLREELDA